MISSVPADLIQYDVGIVCEHCSLTIVAVTFISSYALVKIQPINADETSVLVPVFAVIQGKLGTS